VFLLSIEDNNTTPDDPFSRQKAGEKSTDVQPLMVIQMFATSHLNQGLRIFFSAFVRVSLRRRARIAREGITVPPIAIFSITNECS